MTHCFVHWAEDLEALIWVPLKSNYSIMLQLPVISTWVKLYQIQPSIRHFDRESNICEALNKILNFLWKLKITGMRKLLSKLEIHIFIRTSQVICTNSEMWKKTERIYEPSVWDLATTLSSAQPFLVWRRLPPACRRPDDLLRVEVCRAMSDKNMTRFRTFQRHLMKKALLHAGYLPYAVGKQPSIPLINLGRKWTLKWWWWYIKW